MSVGPLVLELIAAFCIAFLLLHHYGRISKQHLLVTVATLTAWYFSLIIVFILPLDVSSTFYRQCNSTIKKSVATILPNSSTYSTTGSDSFTTTTTSSVAFISSQTSSFATDQTATTIETIAPSNNITTSTYFPVVNHSVLSQSLQVLESGGSEDVCEKPWSFVPKNTLPSMWHIVYWTSQLLTWLILPFMQSYSCAGDFSVLGKIKRAVIENAVYYGSYLLIFVALLIYVAASPQLSLDIVELRVILITAANTWGLFLLVLLLGYGLVEVPRGVWHAANVGRSLAVTYFRLAKLSTEKQEASEDLDDVLEEVKRLSTAVQYNNPHRKYVDIIISKCPENFQKSVSQGMDDFQDFNQERNDIPSENSLVRLHRKVITAYHTQTRTTRQWRILMNRALHLEDIVTNSKSMERHWKEEYPPMDQSVGCTNRYCSSSFLWYWYCLVQPKVRQVFAVCLVILSLMVVWSECTFFTQNPVLSLFAIFINLAKKNLDYFYIELASCLIISYLCVCAYFTVFRIKFFNYYYIAGHHQTDESSLLFVGIMLCRLTAPLCLNFLGMIHLDSHIAAGDTTVETAYTQIMGHLDVIPFISDGFNIYFPILVCVLCAATYFNLGQRCLSAIGFQRFIDAADDMTSDMVDEGRQLVNREKRRQQRELKSQQRAEWKNEFGSESSMKNRQWLGRTMQNAENESAGSLARYSKKKSDKVELLDDVGPTDYSSTANIKVDDGGLDDEVVWEKTSRWASGSSQKKAVFSRPPKNLFDDV